MNFGEVLKITGSDPQLGAWDPLSDSSPVLSWSEGDLWLAEIKAPPGSEFKVVKCYAEGSGDSDVQYSILEWEEGGNRCLSSGEEIYIELDGDPQHVTIATDMEGEGVVVPGNGGEGVATAEPAGPAGTGHERGPSSASRAANATATAATTVGDEAVQQEETELEVQMEVGIAGDAPTIHARPEEMTGKELETDADAEEKERAEAEVEERSPKEVEQDHLDISPAMELPEMNQIPIEATIQAETKTEPGTVESGKDEEEEEEEKQKEKEEERVEDAPRVDAVAAATGEAVMEQSNRGGEHNGPVEAEKEEKKGVEQEEETVEREILTILGEDLVGGYDTDREGEPTDEDQDEDTRTTTFPEMEVGESEEGITSGTEEEKEEAKKEEEATMKKQEVTAEEVPAEEEEAPEEDQRVEVQEEEEEEKKKKRKGAPSFTSFFGR